MCGVLTHLITAGVSFGGDIEEMPGEGGGYKERASELATVVAPAESSRHGLQRRATIRPVSGAPDFFNLTLDVHRHLTGTIMD